MSDFTEGWKDVKLVGWNEHCSDSMIATVVKVIPAGDIKFPTVFRPVIGGSPTGGWVDPNDPNLDPAVKNSIFFPGVSRQVEEYHLYIYNRWGELIFQSHDVNHGWDGYIDGRRPPRASTSGKSPWSTKTAHQIAWRGM